MTKKVECWQIFKFLRFKMVWNSSFEKIIYGVKLCAEVWTLLKKRRLFRFYIECLTAGKAKKYRRVLYSEIYFGQLDIEHHSGRNIKLISYYIQFQVPIDYMPSLMSMTPFFSRVHTSVQNCTP